MAGMESNVIGVIVSVSEYINGEQGAEGPDLLKKSGWASLGSCGLVGHGDFRQASGVCP